MRGRPAAGLCLAALLVGQLAQAKTYDIIVVAPRSSAAANNSLERNRLRATEQLLRILDLAHTDYRVIYQSQTTSEQARLGVFGKLDASGNSTVPPDSARAVIIANSPGGEGAGVYGAANVIRADSIMRIARGGPQIPWLVLVDNTPEFLFSGSPIFDDEALAVKACSTGVAGARLTAPTTWPYLTNNRTLRFPFETFAAAYLRNTSQPPAGGLRVVLGGATPNFVDSSKSQGGLNAKFPQGSHTLDNAGVAASATDDTMYVWDRLWNIATLPTAKTMTFVSWGGAGFLSTDSLLGAKGAGWEVRSESCISILLFGLAHFDSLTSGLIFKNMQEPRRLGLTVDGALRRNWRHLSPGISAQDTTSFYNVLDSLRTFNIPVTFGVDVDSADAFAADVIRLKNCSPAHFSPQVWGGISDSTKNQFVGTGTRPRDVFGRFNNRAFVGDGSGIGADSSVYGYAKRSLALCDSIFGARSSHFLLPPEDDYSPKQMRPANKPTAGAFSYFDSLTYAVRIAGATGMRTNGKWTDSDAGYAKTLTNIRGWSRESGDFINPIDGKPLRILKHAGFRMLGGGAQWAVSYSDSAAPFDTTAFGPSEYGRNLFAMWDMNDQPDADQWDNFGSFDAGFYAWKNVKYKFEDFQDPRFLESRSGFYAGGQIMKLQCSDLSGRQPDPAIAGWFVVKFLNDLFRACNSATWQQKPIMIWSYPEDIHP